MIPTIPTLPCPHGVSGRICWACFVLANNRGHLPYDAWVKEIAAEMGSDGCSRVLPFYLWCCFEHDIHYRAGVRRTGSLISKADSDTQFRSCMRRYSPIGGWSIIARIRWWFVKTFASPSAPEPQRFARMIDPVAVEAHEHRLAILHDLGLVK